MAYTDEEVRQHAREIMMLTEDVKRGTKKLRCIFIRLKVSVAYAVSLFGLLSYITVFIGHLSLFGTVASITASGLLVAGVWIMYTRLWKQEAKQVVQEVETKRDRLQKHLNKLYDTPPT